MREIIKKLDYKRKLAVAGGGEKRQDSQHNSERRKECGASVEMRKESTSPQPRRSAEKKEVLAAYLELRRELDRESLSAP